MWTYIPQWLVQDGQVEELEVGSTLWVWISAFCRSAEVVQDSTRPLGMLAVETTDDPDWRRSYWYDVTGIAGPSHAIQVGGDDGTVIDVGSEFLLRSDQVEVTARTDGFFLPDTDGRLVTMRCALDVMAAYEIMAFALPATRSKWSVARLQIERRALIPCKQTGPNGVPLVEYTPGDVVELTDVSRMRKWPMTPPASVDRPPRRWPMWPTCSPLSPSAERTWVGASTEPDGRIGPQCHRRRLTLKLGHCMW